MKYTLKQIEDKIIALDYKSNLDIGRNYKVLDKLDLACDKHNTNFTQTVRDLFKGHIACKKCKSERDSNYNTFEETSNKIHKNKYNYSLVDYKNNNTKVTIICPIHGEFNQLPRSHISGRGCSECSRHTLIDKNFHREHKENMIKSRRERALNIFKEKCKKFSSNLSVDFDTYEGGAKETLKVNCKIHGDFICKPRNFIASLHGCVKCTENLNGHSLSNFIKICKNKNKEEATLYIIKIFSEHEIFYKIGITSNTVKKRYSSKNKLGYNYKYEVVQEIKDSPENVWKAEKLLIKLYRDFHYIPKTVFNGSLYECFKVCNTHFS